MKIAVPADNDRGLDSTVSQHFGRCPYFVLVDLEGEHIANVKVVQNPYFAEHRPGQVPDFIAGQGAQVMLCGGMGRRAIEFFKQHQVEPLAGAGGSVRDAIDRYLGGQLQPPEPCHDGHEHGQHHHQHQHHPR